MAVSTSSRDLTSPAGAALVWFRDDLRLADNPALTAAARGDRPVVGLYVLDESRRPLGGAARWWLHHSLAALAASLAGHGVRLILRRGREAEAVAAVLSETGAGALHWNRRAARADLETDASIKAAARTRGIEVVSHQANLLHEPWALAPKSGPFFRVYTPFSKAVRALGEPRAPLPVPALTGATTDAASDRLDDWGLLPGAPDWAGGIRAAWTPGEAGAEARLAAFLAGGLRGYADDRDRPDLASTSRLSPHLRFGEISPYRVWHAARFAENAPSRPAKSRDVEKFLSEVLWRDFAFHLLHHADDLARRNFQPRFDAFPWRDDVAALAAWRRGRTGYPMVDAGMRELWATGWMHNRVRMIVGSFLVKHLLLDWRAGEAWFADTLVDACPANNTASWQWVAGTGADAAPYFRIFNPMLQGAKFDPEGAYVKRWVPELARVPAAHVHTPWEAPPAVLAAAGVRLGTTYPRPIVDHETARARALEAFRSIGDDRAEAAE